jgi:glycine/D-amino acid oxidase-like deaminating enzyme
MGSGVGSLYLESTLLNSNETTMNTFDWIVIGAGITGAALAYELVQQGFSTLLVEQHSTLQGATRFGYGGIAYWAGTTELTRQLCAEGIALHRSLPDELAADTQFRELDLLLTIPPDVDPQAIEQFYSQFAIPPRLLSIQAACELEPLLNPAAIAGALTVKHGHISQQATVQAYTDAFIRRGGRLQIGIVSHLQHQQGRFVGINCGQEIFHSNQVVVCAGGLSRKLLHHSGIPVRLYFTHAELVDIPPADLQLRTIVMPADSRRFQLEAQASSLEQDVLWDEPGHQPAAPIVDAGAVQFLDGSIRIGQISRALTDPEAAIDAAASERDIRTQVGQLLPSLQDLPGAWRHCLVAFSCDHLPLVGAIPTIEGIYLFSGFSNPLAITPPLARRFAAALAGSPDALLAQLTPARFTKQV